MARIHPLACVDSAARVADDAEIGPFCVVGPHAEIGSGSRLIAHVHVEGHTTIGPRTLVYPHAALGTAPQSVGYRGGPMKLVIGADCQIREGVTMNIGSEDGVGVTTVGDRGYYMANAHVGHDCTVGDDVIFANCATLGGHVEIGDHVFIAGLSAVHQHTRVGAQALIGAISGVRGDVIPFGMVSGTIARMVGLNVVGMRRRGLSVAAVRAARRAYHLLFRGTVAAMADRVAQVEAEFGAEPVVQQMLAFVRVRGKRPLCRAGAASDEE